MSEALYIDERICGTCGKKFDVQRPDLWRYVRIGGRGQLKMWFCSLGCMRKFDLRKDEDEMVKHDRKQIAEEMIRLAGEGQITSPAKYMMSIGYKNPYQAWDVLKADLECHNAELYTRLMDALGEKGKPRERKARIETPEAKKAGKAQTPEGPVKGPVTPDKLYEEIGKGGYKELPKITQPVAYDGMTVREVEGLFGRYRRTDVAGNTYIDFEPADGADTMSLTVDHWKKFMAEHGKAVRILGGGTVTGTWINAELEKPKDSGTVLCVKQLFSGRLDICLGHWHDDLQEYDYKTGRVVRTGRWVTGGGNNNVLWWMPLPKMPEVKP